MYCIVTLFTIVCDFELALASFVRLTCSFALVRHSHTLTVDWMDISASTKNIQVNRFLFFFSFAFRFFVCNSFVAFLLWPHIFALSRI